MRHSPTSFTAVRVAIEDVELEGVLFPAGTYVVRNTAAANRDPDVYDDPERFDITREGAPAMLTLGGGVHYCLGCASRQGRARGSVRGDGSTDARPAPHRSSSLAAGHGVVGSDDTPRGLRPRALTRTRAFGI